MLLAAAAALLLLIGGGVAGYFIAKAPTDLFEEADSFEEDWIAAVAGQLSLYDAASVAAIPVNDAEMQAQLTKLGDVVKLDLSQPRVALEGLTLRAPIPAGSTPAASGPPSMFRLTVPPK